MYTADHIFPVLPIKYLINKYGKMTTPFKLATGMKPSVSHLSVLCCPCVVHWWDLERISADAGMQFTSTDFWDKCQTCGVYLTLEAP